MLKITPTPTHDCKKAIMSIQDAMYVLGGKWKIRIIAGLLYGPKRYSDLLRDVCGISGKVLSRELKELEINRLVKRSVKNDKPITVIYELTEYGDSTKEIISVLADWGERHREIILQEPLELSYDEVSIVP